LHLALGDEAVKGMATHLELLAKWNRAYNLTTVDDTRRAIAVHLLDSLSILPFLVGQRVLDVGTGAGFPGLPLALARPDMNFVLLDSRGKKVRFVETVVRAAGITNAKVVQERFERYPAGDKFDTLCARAFSSLAALYRSGRRLLAPGGRILAMKGEFPTDELSELRDGEPLRCEVIPLAVPFLDASRHLVIVEPEH
jgi:16S rRNA (guanine527-N7)-methyltransferase